MKNFRLIIRMTFLLFVVLTILIGMNDDKLIKEGFLIWERGVFTFYENTKIWGLIGLIIITTQFVLENFQIFSLKRKLKDKDDEILQLKAKLYDKGSEVASAPLADSTPEAKTSEEGQEIDKD